MKKLKPKNGKEKGGMDDIDEVVIVMLDALIMVRDADDDCKKMGLSTMPHLARQKLDNAIKMAERRNKAHG